MQQLALREKEKHIKYALPSAILAPRPRLHRNMQEQVGILAGTSGCDGHEGGPGIRYGTGRKARR